LWQAWMDLASIYECDANYADAFTTYRKVFEDCPKSIVIPWLARVRMGELADRVTSSESPKGIFDDIVRSPHPFVAPRAIAQYYRGMITGDELRALWDEMYPEDKGYLFCFIKKAVMERRWNEARDYLDDLMESLPPTSWLYIQTEVLHAMVRERK